MITGVVVLIAVAAVGAVQLRPSVRSSDRWRATLTPLASIIGSGFLVVTPLLVSAVGSWAPLAIVGIVAVAYWIGSAVRLAIVEVEPVLEGEAPGRALVDLERLSRLLLGFAYVVSVAFYVRLMASFVLRSAGDGELAAQLLTTATLAAIGALGWLRGLHGLELLEEVAVGTKLAIIGGLLAGLVLDDLGDLSAFADAYHGEGLASGPWTSMRVLAGMLLVVQGFETSRYLGAHYDRATRVGSMRTAQLLSGGIYVAFVSLSVGLFETLPAEIDETSIIDVAAEITPLLAPLLVLAAVASQLSAAVADTAGGGEMLTGTTRAAPAAGVGFVFVAGSAIAIVWLADVLAIISLASRAFAAYYFVQALMGLVVLLRRDPRSRPWMLIASYITLLTVLAFVVVFAIPADA